MRVTQATGGQKSPQQLRPHTWETGTPPLPPPPPTKAEGRVGGKAEGAPRGPQVRHRPWSELKRTKGQGDPATLQWWIPMGSWSELKRTEGQRRPCETPTAEKPCDSPIAVSERRRSGYQVPDTVMRQRLIRTVKETVNQDSGKDVSAWAPGRPPIEAESAGQQTAGCHPRRQRNGAPVADSAPRCPRWWWWRWKKGPTRALPRSEVHPGAGRNQIGAGKSRVGPARLPPPPNPFRAPTPWKGQDGGGRAKTVGALGGPHAGNGPGLYFGERRGRGPTKPRHGYQELVGWGHLPCPAL